MRIRGRPQHTRLRRASWATFASRTKYDGMRRQYDPSVLHRIAMIVTLQRSGFTLAEISDLLAPDAFADGRGALQQKLEMLVDQRRELDRAIEGIEHAIACPAPSPLECDGFRNHLDGVLPVKRRRGEA